MNAAALRAAILQLAIQGKLVSQSADEPAVSQIGEKPGNVPFPVPEKWAWVQLKFFSEKRKNIEPADMGEDVELWSIPSYDQGKPERVNGKHIKSSKKEVFCGDVLLSKIVPTIERAWVVSGDFPKKFASTEWIVFSGKKILDPEFMAIFFKSPEFRKEMLGTVSGMGSLKRASPKRIMEFFVPVPPIEEQHRIVKRINELLPLVAVYGKEYEALSRLNKELPGRLRASILQEAILGKLVPQLDEEPAVKQIGEAPKEVLFAIPEKWKWVQLKNLVDVTKQKIPDKDFLYLDVSGVAPSKKSIQSLSAIKANDAPSRARKIVKEGMVLFSTVRPYFLKTVVAENLDLEKETIASTAFAIFSCKNELLNKFIWLVLQSPYFLEYVTSCQKGSTYPAITDKLFYSAYVPLPPVEEQRRIVQKVIELLGEVEKLS